jgi:hypothetical protein
MLLDCSNIRISQFNILSSPTYLELIVEKNIKQLLMVQSSPQLSHCDYLHMLKHISILV